MAARSIERRLPVLFIVIALIGLRPGRWRVCGTRRTVT